MKSKLTGFFIIFFLCFNFLKGQAVEDSIFIPKLFRNDQRILLLFSPSKTNTKYQKQLEILLKNKEKLIKREVALYKLYKEEGLNPENKYLASAHVLKLRDQFGIEEDEFAFLYVGMNANVKMRRNKVTPIETLITILDTTRFVSPEYEFH